MQISNMPVVTRSQSKKLQLKDISEHVKEGDRDSLTKKSLLISLQEIQLRRLILEIDPDYYQNIYVKKELIKEEQNCISDWSFDKLIKDMILFLICICLYLTANLLFYV